MTNKKSLTNSISTKTSNKSIKKIGILACGIVSVVLIAEPALAALDIDAGAKAMTEPIIKGIEKYAGIACGIGGVYQCLWGVGNDGRQKAILGFLGAGGSYLGILGIMQMVGGVAS